VEAQRRATRLPGLALGIIHGDRIVHLRGFGQAGPSGRPVTSQTPFMLASTTKSLTALAVMQLVEAGKVDLDAPVQRYLPGFAWPTRPPPPASPCGTCSTTPAGFPPPRTR
jgi:CubicO group peptidase (beta-lactamase class C family)